MQLMATCRVRQVHACCKTVLVADVHREQMFWTLEIKTSSMTTAGITLQEHVVPACKQRQVRC